MVKQARNSIKLRIYPHVDHMQINAVQTREHVDGSPARKEIEHHLVRDRARIRADTLGGDAVVCSKNVCRFPNWGAERLPTDGDDLRRQIFKPAQAAERLGERIEVSPGTECAIEARPGGVISRISSDTTLPTMNFMPSPSSLEFRRGRRVTSRRATKGGRQVRWSERLYG